VPEDCWIKGAGCIFPYLKNNWTDWERFGGLLKIQIMDWDTPENSRHTKQGIGYQRIRRWQYEVDVGSDDLYIPETVDLDEWNARLDDPFVKSKKEIDENDKGWQFENELVWQCDDVFVENAETTEDDKRCREICLYIARTGKRIRRARGGHVENGCVLQSRACDR
jgi:hypothetical protein